MVRKQSGFTLSEVSVVIGFVGIISLIVASVMSLASNQYFTFKSKLEAEEIGARLEYDLREAFAQAINVQFTPAAFPGALPANLGGNPGQILGGPGADAQTQTINFQRIADPGVDFTTIAIFLREAGTALIAGGGVPMGAPLKTALFFRRPSPVSSGVLFLHLGNRFGAMRPSYDIQYYDRITLLQVTKHGHPSQNVTTSVDFHVRIRYARQNMQDGAMSWCPALDMGVVAGCTTQAAWADIDRQFTVTLRNNLVHSINNVGSIAGAAGNNEERVLGGVYFFRPILPTNTR